MGMHLRMELRALLDYPTSLVPHQRPRSHHSDNVKDIEL